MRIAFLLDSVSRNAGGLFGATSRLAQELRAAGEEVRVFGVADEWSATDAAQWAPVPVEVVPARGPRRFGCAPELGGRLASFAPDVVMPQGLWTYTSLVSRRWQRRTGRPVVIHPHGMLDPWAVRNSAWKKRVAGWLFEYGHLRHAACLRALCPPEADAIRAFGLKSPIAVIPNGMDLPDVVANSSPAAFPIPRAGRRVLLYLGRIHPKKGLVNLLRAWARVRRAPDAQSPAEEWLLVIAGWEEGGHETELKRLCDEVGLAWADVRTGKGACSGSAFESASVCFVGPQFGGAKAACYAACDAFVLPSFSEGLPMVVLEAWAWGKPVLMTPQCNLPEGFAAGAALRVEAEVESLAGGLRELLAAPPAALQALGQNGRRLVAERFAWPRLAGDMRAVLLWLRGGGPRPACVLNP